jgi:hypothetical protein
VSRLMPTYSAAPLTAAVRDCWFHVRIARLAGIRGVGIVGLGRVYAVS